MVDACEHLESAHNPNKHGSSVCYGSFWNKAATNPSLLHNIYKSIGVLDCYFNQTVNLTIKQFKLLPWITQLKGIIKFLLSGPS